MASHDLSHGRWSLTYMCHHTSNQSKSQVQDVLLVQCNERCLVTSNRVEDCQLPQIFFLYVKKHFSWLLRWVESWDSVRNSLWSSAHLITLLLSSHCSMRDKKWKMLASHLMATVCLIYTEHSSRDIGSNPSPPKLQIPPLSCIITTISP